MEKRDKILRLVIVVAVLIFLVFIITTNLPKSKKNETVAQPIESDLTPLGLPKPRSKKEIAERMKYFEAEEKQHEETYREFYKTPAGKIWRKHPEWSKEDCEKLARGDVWIGMDYKMLVLQRGDASHTSQANYGTGVQLQWCWLNSTPTCFYDKNNDGKIDSYN